MKEGRLESIVGAAAVAAVIVALVAVSFVGDVNPAIAKQTHWVLFKDVNFLAEGNVVRSAGLMVGMVEELRLRPEGVLAKIVVEDQVTVHPGYSIQVRSLTTLGGRFAEIYRGDTRAPAIRSSLARPLAGELEPEVFKPIAGMVEEAEPMVVTALANVSEILEKLESAQGTLGKLFSDAELRENVERAGQRLEVTTAQLRKTLEKVEQGTGTLGRLLNEPRFERAFANTSDRLGSALGKIADGHGPLGALTTDEAVSDSLTSAGEHLTEVVDGLAGENGILGQEARAEKMREDLSITVQNLGKIATNVSEGKGPLVVLMNDPEVGRNLTRARDHLAAFGDRPKTSTIARLTDDPRLIVEIEAALRDYGSYTEDSSDVPPLSPTLGGLLFSNFGGGDDEGGLTGQ